MLGGDLLKARLAGQALLEKDASSPKHSQASVLELLQLQLRELLIVILKGVEVQAEPEVARGLVLRVLLPDRQLNHTNGGQDLQPRGARELTDSLETRGDLPIVQGVVDLGEPQAHHGEHGQSAVLELWRVGGREGEREGGRDECLVGKVAEQRQERKGVLFIPFIQHINSTKEENRRGGGEGMREGGGRKRTDCPVTVEAAFVLGELKGVPDAARLHIRAQDLVHGHAGHATSCLMGGGRKKGGTAG